VCDCTPASGAVKPAPNNPSESFFDAPIRGANSSEISGAGKNFRLKDFFQSTTFATWKNCLSIGSSILRACHDEKRTHFFASFPPPKSLTRKNATILRRIEDPLIKSPQKNTATIPNFEARR
jgi:hypothetical protein